jgi:hypothetical protein
MTLVEYREHTTQPGQPIGKLEEFDIDPGPNLEEETVKDKAVVVGQGVSSEGKDTAEHPNIDMYETGEEIVWWMLNPPHRIPREELECRHCGKKGHAACDCTKIETEGEWKGYVKIRPFCCSGSHIFANCKWIRLKLQELFHFFVVKRNGKPPLPCP